MLASASTATHPSLATALICIAFGLLLLRGLYKCLTGHYDNPNPPQRVIEKRGRR